jgi:hypothetical protein
MVNKSSNINKGSDHFSTYLIVHKKKNRTITHDAENPGLEQAKYCGVLNR